MGQIRGANSPVLAGLSQHDVSPAPGVKGMAVQDIQRILGVARRATTADVLSGALAALLGSRFLKLAGVDLTLRMIKAGSTNADLGSRLFSGSLAGWDAYDVSKLGTIATSILADQGEYSGNVASSAAEYLFETRGVTLPPLLDLEEALGLYPQRPR